MEKRKRSKVGVFFTTLLIILILVGGGAYALLAKSFNEIEKIPFQTSSFERPAPTSSGAVNILLLGSDSQDATDTDVESDEMTGFRSDAIMVAQISPDKKHVTVMSIMRDNWVEIEGFGEAKINAAFSYGGIPLAVNTIENFIGTRIDHGALVDFQSFKGLTDTLGGITINNDLAFQPSHAPELFFDEGEITLTGEEALAFVRERMSFADGDYQRVRNQQTYMKGLAGKMLSRETILNPLKLSKTFDELQPYLIIDDELTLPKTLLLAFSASSLRADDFTFFTSPTHGVGWSPDGQSIIVPNEEELVTVRDHFVNGTLHEYEPLADY